MLALVTNVLRDSYANCSVSLHPLKHCSESYVARVADEERSRRGWPASVIMNELQAFWHVFGVSVTNNSGFWIWWLDLLPLLYNYNKLLQLRISLQLNPSSLTVEASLHSAARSTTDCKRPSLSPIKLRQGPRTENTLRTRYPSNSSIVIELCLCCRCIETADLLLLSAYSLPWDCV
jgi:hypothetical protein